MREEHTTAVVQRYLDERTTLINRALNRFRISGFAEFGKPRPFPQNVPDDFADPVSDGPDRLNVSQSDHEAFENRLQVAAVGSGGGLGRLT